MFSIIGDFKKDLLLFYKSIKELDVNKFKLSIIFITMVASNILNLANPLLFGNIINGIVRKSIVSVKINIFYMVFIYIVSNILNYINSIMLIKLSYDLEIKMKENVFDSILKIPYTNFLKTDKGRLINNIEDDATVFSNLLSNNINIIISVISMIISFLFMLYISPLLTFMILLTFPITACIFIFSGRKIKIKENEYKDKHDNFLSFINETVYGWKFLKIFSAERERKNIFKRIIKSLYKLQIKKFKIEISSEILTNITSFLINILNILLAIYLIFNGNLTLGMFTAFNEYSEAFKGVLLMLSRFNSTIQQTSVSLMRVNEVLQYKENSGFKKDLYHELDKVIQNIEIKDLSYSTLDNIEILKNVNIKFQRNNIYVIKGESGSGKTTLLNMLNKFIESYDGQIIFDNINLKNIDEKSLRNRVNYITQDNYLFSLSIKENITLHRDIPFKKIEEVCKKLKIHNSINSLPNQYDTIINKNGINLSGGEKQRLCIARSIINNPDVYLFDEITSAIDKKNINGILKIIEEISKDSIVILTTHEDFKFSIPVIEYCLKNKKLNQQ